MRPINGWMSEWTTRCFQVGYRRVGWLNCLELTWVLEGLRHGFSACIYARVWASCLSKCFDRDWLRDGEFVTLIITWTQWQRCACRLKTLNLSTKRHSPIVPRYRLPLVSQRLIHGIVHARAQVSIVLQVLQMALPVVVKPLTGISGWSIHTCTSFTPCFLLFIYNPTKN